MSICPVRVQYAGVRMVQRPVSMLAAAYPPGHGVVRVRVRVRVRGHVHVRVLLRVMLFVVAVRMLRFYRLMGMGMGLSEVQQHARQHPPTAQRHRRTGQSAAPPC